MSMSYEIDLKVKKYGDSYVLILDRSFRKLLDVNIGDIVHVTIEKKETLKERNPLTGSATERRSSVV